MKKSMKKIAVFAVCAALCLGALAGCTQKTDTTATDGQQTANMPNPMTEGSYDDQVAKASIGLNAPEGATDVKYFTIDLGDGKAMAETQFVLDGKTYNYRAETTDQTTAYDNSGCYYDNWTTGTAKVAHCDAVTEVVDDCAVIYWLDVVPGIDYSLTCTTPGATADDVTAVANAVFVPAQGNA